jgi:hypothetical protein
MGDSDTVSWQVSGFRLLCSGNAIECRQIAPIREVVPIPTRRASEGACVPIPDRVSEGASPTAAKPIAPRWRVGSVALGAGSLGW